MLRFAVSFAEVQKMLLSHSFLTTICASSLSVNRTSALVPAPCLPTCLFQSCSLSVTSQSTDASPQISDDMQGSLCSFCPLRRTLANLFTSEHERQSTRLIREVKLNTLQKAVNRRQNNTVFWCSTQRLFCILLFLFLIIKKCKAAWLESGMENEY